MRPGTVANLVAARKAFRACADKLTSRRVGKAPLASKYRHMQLALGLCSDWQRWAASLTELSFSGKSERLSSRREGLVEATRFAYAWTGTNALFARDEVLELILNKSLPNNQRSELTRFRILYDFAQLPRPLVDREEKLLNNLLNMDCAAEPLPGASIKSSYRMWEVIFYKYITADQRKKGIGKTISSAVLSGMLPRLDAPSILYAARNWQIHGVLISSSFRGTPQKYQTFIDSINFVLSEILARRSARLLPLI